MTEIRQLKSTLNDGEPMTDAQISQLLDDLSNGYKVGNGLAHDGQLVICIFTVGPGCCYIFNFENARILGGPGGDKLSRAIEREIKSAHKKFGRKN